MRDFLRNELIWLLDGGNAHVNFDAAIAHIPKKYYGAEVPNSPYTLWRQLQHLQISQRDILEYIQNPNYQELSWPDEYWPQEKAPPKATSWDKRVSEFRNDLEELKKIVKNPKSKLLESIPYVKNGPSLLREILLVVDHNSYHIGQMILLRGQLGIWTD